MSSGGLWSGDTVNYAYTNRLRSGVTVGSWNQTYGYDKAFRLTNLTSAAGSFGYAYDAARKYRVSRLLLPNTAYITNTFDAVARLAGTYLKNSGNHVLDGFTYGYDRLGQRTNIARDYGLTSSTAVVGYDAIGELTSWTASEANGTSRLNEQFGYVYDAAGNLKQRTNNALVQSFSVDAANALTNITRTGTLTVSGNTPAPASSVNINGNPALRYGDFTFASSNGFTLANGNNTFTNIARNYYGTVSVTNTLTANLPANVVLQFDANGNLTNDGSKSLSYDVENQLTNVTVAGQWREDFLYDGFNRRRITRQYLWDAGTSGWALTNETRFIYDGNVVIQEWNSNNVAQVTYTRGSDLSGLLQGAGGIGGLLARTDTNGSVIYHADGNGNVTSLINTNRYIVARYLYDPYGRMLGKWGALADANVYRFSSKEYDPKAGLYYFKNRLYDSNLQRWLNSDPIGERGGLNLYGYVGNGPINYVDALGLWQFTIGGAWGFGGSLSFGYNGGRSNFQLEGGVGLGFKMDLDQNDSGGIKLKGLVPKVGVNAYAEVKALRLINGEVGLNEFIQAGDCDKWQIKGALKGSAGFKLPGTEYGANIGGAVGPEIQGTGFHLDDAGFFSEGEGPTIGVGGMAFVGVSGGFSW